MSKLLKTSAEGRKCLFPQCKCTLSIYNHDGYCHVHREQSPQDPKAKLSLAKHIAPSRS
jgi:hypothetical protein